MQRMGDSATQQNLKSLIQQTQIVRFNIFSLTLVLTVKSWTGPISILSKAR